MFSDILSNSIYQPFQSVIKEFSEQGTCYLVGGAVRDFMNGRIPRDLDVVVDTQSELIFEDFSGKRNSFGGWKLSFPSYEMDIWRLQDTWGIQHANMKASPSSYCLTTLFSIDSLIYDLSRHTLYLSPMYQRSVLMKELDILYLPNPYPVHVCARSFALSRTYDLTFSPYLKEYLIYQLPHLSEDEFHSFQLRHYKRLFISLEEASFSLFHQPY